MTADDTSAACPEYTGDPGRRGSLIEAWFTSPAGSPVGYREPTPGEVAYWTGRVRAVGALVAFREIYYTPEAVTYRIEQWYSLLLQRYPDDRERAYWYPREVEPDVNVGVLIASTPEYAAKIIDVVPPR